MEKGIPLETKVFHPDLFPIFLLSESLQPLRLCD
jgi:hypothetical protein